MNGLDNLVRTVSRQFLLNTATSPQATKKAAGNISRGFLMRSHKGLIESVSTRPPHELDCNWETVMAADRGEEIVIWDPRW